MKRSIRIFSLVLALVMAFCMSATAEGAAWLQHTVEVDVAGTKANSVVKAAYDPEGRLQLTIDCAELNLDQLFAELTENGITLGNPEGGYVTMSFDEIAKFIDIINFVQDFGVTYEQAEALHEYKINDTIAQDIAIIQGLVANEVNRLAACATEMGLVTITETGALTIQATVQDVVDMVIAYINSVIADETILASVNSLNLLQVLGIDLTEAVAQLKAALEMTAAEMAAAPITDIEGEFYLNVNEAGEMVVRYAFATPVSGIELNASVSGQDIMFTLVETALDQEVFNMDYTSVAGAVGFDVLVKNELGQLVLNYAAEGQNSVANLDYSTINGAIKGTLVNGAESFDFSIEGNNDTENIAIKAIGTAEGIVITAGGSNSLNNKNFSLNGNITANGFVWDLVENDPEMGETTLNSTFDAATMAFNIEVVNKLGDVITTYKASDLNGVGSLELKAVVGEVEVLTVNADGNEEGLFFSGVINDGEMINNVDGKLVPSETGLVFDIEFSVDDVVIAAFDAELNIADEYFVAYGSFAGVEAELTLTERNVSLLIGNGEEKFNIYAANNEVAHMASVIAGIDIYTAEDPETALPGLTVTLAYDKENPFIHVMTYELNNLVNNEWIVVESATSAFDGETYAMENFDGENTFALTIGASESNENKEELVINGVFNDQPITGKIGVEGDYTDNNNFDIVFYADIAAVESAGIKIFAKEEGNTTEEGFVGNGTYSLVVNENGVETTIGTIKLGVEGGQGGIVEVESVELTAEQLFQMLIPEPEVVDEVVE